MLEIGKVSLGDEHQVFHLNTHVNEIPIAYFLAFTLRQPAAKV